MKHDQWYQSPSELSCRSLQSLSIQLVKGDHCVGDCNGTCISSNRGKCVLPGLPIGNTSKYNHIPTTHLFPSNCTEGS